MSLILTIRSEWNTPVIYVININLLMTVGLRVNAFTLMMDTLTYTSSMNTITIKVSQHFQEVP